MEVNGQLHDPQPYPQGKELPVPIGYEAQIKHHLMKIYGRVEV
jgi:hypothetical protein